MTLDWISEDAYVQSQKRLIDVLPTYLLESDDMSIWHKDNQGTILLEKRKNWGGFSYYRARNFNERFGIDVPKSPCFRSDIVNDKPANTKTQVTTSTGKRYWATKEEMAEIDRITAEARQARIDYIYIMTEVEEPTNA